MDFVQLGGKHVLVAGLKSHSLAFDIGKRLIEAGATVHFSLHKLDNHRRALADAGKRGYTPEEKAFFADTDPARMFFYECDVAVPESIAALAADLPFPLSGVFHSIAYANRKTMLGATMLSPDLTAEDIGKSYVVSAGSLGLLVGGLVRKEKILRGGSVVTLTFDPGGVVPGYAWMHGNKQGLQGLVQALAFELGLKYGIRINAVAAGPVPTFSAQAIPGFEQAEAGWNALAPLGWVSSEDRSAIADGVLFFLGAQSRSTTGHTMPVDGGVQSVKVSSNDPA